jgi:hypothetical protein
LAAVAVLLLFNLAVFILVNLEKADPASNVLSVPSPVIPVFTPGPGGYLVYQSFPLARDKNGIDGALEILLDKDLLSHGSFGMMALFVRNDFHKFKPAVLRTLSTRGKEIGRVTFSLPVASLQGALNIYGNGRPVFQVDQLVRTEAYIKTQTSMVELKKGRPMVLPLVLEESHYSSLAMGNQWKWVPARAGRGMDFLAFHSDAASKGNAGEMTYTRFFFDGTKWWKREKKGIPKAQKNGAFPADLEFP